MLFWIIPVVIAGILGAVLLLRRSTGVSSPRLDSKVDVLEMWHEKYPDHPASTVLLEPSGFAALIDLEGGGTGILWVFRNRVVGRVLQQGELQENGTQLRIAIPESREPFLVITIQEPMVRRIWLETLKTVLSEASKS